MALGVNSCNGKSNCEITVQTLAPGQAPGIEMKKKFYTHKKSGRTILVESDQNGDGQMDDRAHVIDVFKRHNDEVVAGVPGERLLVFEAAMGWPPLCEFLEVDVPDDPYPRVNSTQQFKESMKRRR